MGPRNVKIWGGGGGGGGLFSHDTGENWIRLHVCTVLLCESGSSLRDEERGGKQREIVEKTNTRRLRVYYLYNMSLV